MVLGLAGVVSAPAAFAAQPPRFAALSPSIPMADAGTEVVLRALSLLGVNYRFGGNTPDTGLDCSGLVRFVFHETLGMPLPRRSEEMSRVGSEISTRELQPGDLVFFNTLRRAFSHVGIYIGNGQFVHAPAAGKAIRVENLGAAYWARRYNGARRLLDDDGPDAAGQRGTDALVAAGLIPAPAGSTPGGSAPAGSGTAGSASGLTAAALASSRATAPRKPPAAILPLFEVRSLGNELTVN